MKKQILLNGKLLRCITIIACWMLTACASPSVVSTSTPTFAPPTLIQTRTPMFAPTIVPIKTNSLYPSIVVQTNSQFTEVEIMRANYTFNQQVTDGRLIIFAGEVDPKCHKITILDTYMEVRLAFQNLTDEPLFMTSDFFVSINNRLSGGDAVPVYFYEDGSRLWLARDEFDSIREEPRSITEIPAQGKYETVVSILLPSTLRWEDITEISPRRYLAKLIYHNSRETVAGQDNIWIGMISSNLIEFCMEK